MSHPGLSSNSSDESEKSLSVAGKNERSALKLFDSKKRLKRNEPGNDAVLMNLDLIIDRVWKTKMQNGYWMTLTIVTLAPRMHSLV